MAAPVEVHGTTADALSSAPISVDGQPQMVRLGGRGSQFVENLWNGMQLTAGEGSYWLASTATPGTGITLSVATGTAFSDTQALLVLNNTDTVSLQAKKIWLDFIMVIVTTSPTNATNWQLAHRIDAATRGTAGTQLGAVGTAPRPSNMFYGGSSVGQAFALGGSAVSVAASSSVRNVGRNQLRTIAPVVGDILTIKFGSAEMAAGGVGLNTANAQGITVYAPPVVIGPNQSYVCNEWAAARTVALAGEIIVGWVER